MSRHRRKKLFRAAELFFWGLAGLLLGLYALVYLDRTLYQAYQSRAFAHETQHETRGQTEATPVLPGTLLGRIEIPRIGVDAMVINGTSDDYLRRAVGHIPGTALPGQPGNVGLAGHRDTFFRGLRRIRKGDAIDLETLDGTFKYVVESTRIVGPDDGQVLEASSAPTLTLVTCYPFNYIGSAPRRFIVRARIIPRPPVAGAAAATLTR